MRPRRPASSLTSTARFPRSSMCPRTLGPCPVRSRRSPRWPASSRSSGCSRVDRSPSCSRCSRLRSFSPGSTAWNACRTASASTIRSAVAGARSSTTSPRCREHGDPAGMHVESKGLSITLHYRGRPRLEPRVRAFAEAQAARSGLECRPARMSYELHPPIPADKGSALAELSEGLAAVAFIGDDVGDLPRVRRARSAVGGRRAHRARCGAQRRGIRRADLAGRRRRRRPARCARPRAVPRGQRPHFASALLGRGQLVGEPLLWSRDRRHVDAARRPRVLRSLG